MCLFLHRLYIYTTMRKDNLAILRVLGFVEGLSYLVLLGLCMPLKYLMNIPGPTRYVGMIHGILFVAYCLWVLIVAYEKKWTLKTTFWALFASLVPFGTFVADKRIFAVT